MGLRQRGEICLTATSDSGIYSGHYSACCGWEQLVSYYHMVACINLNNTASKTLIGITL